MQHKRVIGRVVAVALILLLTTGMVLAEGPAAGPLGTAFTYQGRLEAGGAPLSSSCDFEFSLWDFPTGGMQVGATQTVTGVHVTDGYFTVQLDFGSGLFRGDPYWLEVAVRCPSSAALGDSAAGAGDFTPLSPRQPLTPAPYALYATGAPWSGLGGVPAGFADGTDNDTTYSAGTGLSLSGTSLSVAAGYRLPQSCAQGEIAEWNGSAWICAADDTGNGGGGWSLTGNAGTAPGTNFLGTTDNKALELKVKGQRAFRLEPNSDSPNLIGGYRENLVTAGVYGATIGGGGVSGNLNRVADTGGTVGGGMQNQAGNDAGDVLDAAYATVGGGAGNEAGGLAATVCGGTHNYAIGSYSGVGGGKGNGAEGNYAAIGGGDSNLATAPYATIPGGEGNRAHGSYSFAAGRKAKALHDGTFVWADGIGAEFSSTANNQFLVRASYGVKIVRETNTFALSHSALQVEQGGNGEAAWFYTTNTNNDSAVLKLLKQPSTSGSDANFIEGLERTGAGAETRKWWIDKDGGMHGLSDFAEALPVAGDPAGYEPGDVLVVSLDRPGGVEKCRQVYDGRVVGVYSTRPGFVGADKGGVTEMGPDDVPVAVLGIVPVKVSAENGPIRPGDLLTTSSTPGHAMRCQGLELCFGRTLGKALEGLAAGQSTGFIRMLVSLQ